jgi:hypothetical protein
MVREAIMKIRMGIVLGSVFFGVGCGSAEGDPAEVPAAQTETWRGGVWAVPSSATVLGRSIDSWTESWWHWTFAVPAAQNPELVLTADCGVGQDGRVFFVPAYDGARIYERTCHIPFGKPVLVPLWVVVNDYPCPDPTFEPAPGQSLEAFLREGAIAYNDLVANMVVTLDGKSIDEDAHRHTTRLFHFEAHASLVGALPDPCLLGTRQPGVSDGFWLMLLAAPGEHVVRVQAVDPLGQPFDHTYRLKVAV